MGQSVWVLLPWLTLPLAWLQLRAIYTVTGRDLNATLAGTARLSLIYSLLLAVGVML
jgi:1,4-dihydroxy-2-naphthoate polyprenyltransferase